MHGRNSFGHQENKDHTQYSRLSQSPQQFNTAMPLYMSYSVLPIQLDSLYETSTRFIFKLSNRLIIV